MSKGALINFAEFKSPMAEAFRTLRTNLQFLAADQNFKTLLITSACPGEGKSTTAANLAISFALTGKNVLIIDCDLRKPQQHSLFEVSNDEGLANLLNKELYPERVIRKTTIPGVNLLPSGPLPKNPAELLSSKTMKDLIESFKADVDLIIFDTPPVVVVTDAAILASEMDGVVLVINAGITKIDLVKKARDLLAMVKANVVGVVLNKMDFNSQGYYYYYSESDGKKKKKKKKDNKPTVQGVNHG